MQNRIAELKEELQKIQTQVKCVPNSEVSSFHGTNWSVLNSEVSSIQCLFGTDYSVLNSDVSPIQMC